MFERHLQASELLKQRLYQLMEEKFSNLVKQDIGDDGLILEFYIPGLANSFHHFEYPINGCVTVKNANKIVKEIRKIDAKLADCISFIYLSKVKVDIEEIKE